MTSVLEISSLSVVFDVAGHREQVLTGLDLAIAAGESYGLVGESGSGKTTAALAVVRHLACTASVTSGRINLAGNDVLDLDSEGLRALRAGTVSMVYQEPGRALNPTMRVGAQLAEVFRLRGATASTARTTAVEALERVHFTDAEAAARRYPHELSGGQQQRIVIAMAVAASPALLILDEPTTGLDVRVEAGVLDLVDELREELSAAVLMISHNLPLVAARCDRVGVLRRGVLVEEGSAATVLARPSHEYSKALVSASPDINAPKRRQVSVPERVAANATVATLSSVSKRFGRTLALDDVSLEIRRGEVLGLVGESGSGKTTLGRCVAGLTTFDGAIDVVGSANTRRRAGSVQIVFQSPDATLNPQRRVREILSRSITLLGGTDTPEQLLGRVGLGENLLDRYPGELSGGQKQRVAIARAFAGPSSLVVCDEPVSALDVSVQAKILDLLEELQETTGVSLLFISHDLAVIRRLADRVGVLNRGALVELGDADQVFSDPAHPYTRGLLDAAIGRVSNATRHLSPV